jgi:hypothetical protein
MAAHFHLRQFISFATTHALPIVVAAALGVGCDRGASRVGHLQARFVESPHDTAYFTADARALRCAGGRGVVLEGTSEANGVLVWVRGGGPTTEGTYVPLPRGDSITPKGAVVSARLATRMPSRGVLLDSGTVVVTSVGGRMNARITGRGVNLSSAARVAVEIRFDSVQAPSDTVECRVEP